MKNISINIIPSCILEKLFSLKEVDMFVLPNVYIYDKVYSNNWNHIIIQKLSNIDNRHKDYLVVEITSFNLIDKSISYEEIILLKNNLFDKILFFIERNIAVCLIIKNYVFKYGYLIIPGNEKN